MEIPKLKYTGKSMVSVCEHDDYISVALPKTLIYSKQEFYQLITELKELIEVVEEQTVYYASHMKGEK